MRNRLSLDTRRLTDWQVAAIVLSPAPFELPIEVAMKYGQQQIEIHQARLPCSLKSIFNFGASVMAAAG